MLIQAIRAGAMKKFTFSLQDLLDLRTHQRKQAETQLSKIQKRRESLEEQAHHISGQLEKMLQASPGTSASSVQFRRRMTHQQLVHTQRKELLQQVEQVKQAEQKAHSHLVEARRAEEMLQSLREQEQTVHAKDRSDINRRRLDDQAIIQHVRNNKPFSL